jgi:hypothetical protein
MPDGSLSVNSWNRPLTEFMKKNVFMAFLALIISGCATNMYRSTGINLNSIDAKVTSDHTSAPAVDIFDKVAGEMGYSVSGPSNIGELSTAGLMYTAGPPASSPKSSPCLLLIIDDNGARFLSSMYGSEKNFISDKSVILFKRALKEEGIQYKVNTNQSISQGGH